MAAAVPGTLRAGPAGAAPRPSRCPPASSLRAGLCRTARHRSWQSSRLVVLPPSFPGSPALCGGTEPREQGQSSSRTA